jgi:small ligand-binding sensory domain FIST
MTAMTPKAVSRLLAETYSEPDIIAVAERLRTELGGNAALGFVFATAEWRGHLEDTLELIRLHARVPRLVGCSGSGVIGTKTELEHRPGLSILLLSIPESSFQIFTISESDLEGASEPGFWREFTGLRPDDMNSWIVLANPAFRDVEKWLDSWNSSFPGKPIVGGLASAGEAEDFLFRDGDVVNAPIIAVALRSPIAMQVLMSQGCRPIGDPSPITKAEDNFILEIGNVPAYQTLETAFLTVPAEERNAVRNNLFLGLAASEYVDEFKRGDFLIRNILGADPQIPGSDKPFNSRSEIRSRLTKTWSKGRKASPSAEAVHGPICFFHAPVADKASSASRVMTLRRWLKRWVLRHWQASSATVKLVRSVPEVSCMAILPLLLY